MLTVLAASVAGTEGTSLWDMIPVIAQGKSLVQIIFGDKDGARKTQEHFLNEGLGTSQLRSAYFLVTGDAKKALDIQGKFFSNLEVVVDSCPLVGHLKGGVHLIAGDTDHGWQALKSATSSTGVLVGGVFGGPAGAVGGHILTDALISGVDRIVNGNQSQPHGIVRYGLNIGNLKPGEHFDELAGLVLDARVGSKSSAVNRKRGDVSARRRGLADERADSVKFRHLIEDDDVRDHVEMPNWFNAEARKNEPGPSKIAHPPAPYDESNELKRNVFRQFVLKSLAYNKDAKLDQYTSNYKPDGNYNRYLNSINIDGLISELGYLTEDEKSLISKDDFRTVNVNSLNTNCLPCSIAGIMKLDLETVQRYIKENLETYDPNTGTSTVTIFQSLQRGKLVRYATSDKLHGLDELKTYIKSNALALKDKHIVLEKMKFDESQSPPGLYGHAVVMKFKMVEHNSDPVMLIVDYQLPAFLRNGKPNPSRFQNFFDLNYYNYFFVNDIELTKSH